MGGTDRHTRHSVGGDVEQLNPRNHVVRPPLLEGVQDEHDINLELGIIGQARAANLIALASVALDS